MKKIFYLTFLALLISSYVFGQTQETYKRVKIHLNGKNPAALASCGIDVEHGFWEDSRFFTGEFSLTELSLLKKAGFYYDVLCEDVVAEFLKNNTVPDLSDAHQRTEAACNFPQIGIPANFKLGSMGGYFTYEEMLEHLQNMKSKFPNLITGLNNIGNFRTNENRLLHWVKISKNPQTDENKPEILYTALHHAREPASLSQMIFFMYHILENYGKDPFITKLINETEMYFVPCLNPDGYIFNQTGFPGGGGMWRKNRRNNGNNKFGVDLNRNYAFGFGEDNIGSSNDPDSEVFRGPSAFSEPETQAIKYFCEQRNFLLALNYHSSGNYLIKPPGSKYTLSDEEAHSVHAVGLELVEHNRFLFGDAVFTVGYTVNGTSDDWMYAKTEEKDRIYAYTPEVGTAFWMASNQIVSVCQSTLLQNLSLAKLAFSHLSLQDKSSTFFAAENPSFTFEVQNIGLSDNPRTKISVKSLSPKMRLTSSGELFYGLKNAERAEFALNFDFTEKPKAGDEFAFEITIDNGITSRKQQFTKIYGETQTVFSDDCENMNKWSGNWGNNRVKIFSGRASITDTPVGNYRARENSPLVMRESIDLTNALQAELSFAATWNMEIFNDGVFVEVSTDNQNWTALCMPSSHAHASGRPAYEGFQGEWRTEKINLKEFVGKKIALRFRLQSNDEIQRDGFYFDEIKILAVAKEGVTLGNERFDNENAVRIYPNPSSGTFRVALDLPQGTNYATAEITDLSGKVIQSFSQEKLNEEFEIQLSKGFYLLRVSSGTRSLTKKIIVN
jgi:flagellar hook assembly protein FlgD